MVEDIHWAEPTLLDLEVIEGRILPEDVDGPVGWRRVRAKLLARGGAPEEAERLAREATETAQRTDYLTCARRPSTVSPRYCSAPARRRPPGLRWRTLSRCTSRRASSSPWPRLEAGSSHRRFVVLQRRVAGWVSTPVRRQIESTPDRPDRIERAGVTARERHFARPPVVDAVLVA